MREIKFRSWEKDKKVMREWEFVRIQWNMLIFESDKVNIMQFTGLKDKNGKEIYEGDIVLFEDTESEYVDVGIGGNGVKVAEQQINNFFPVVYWNGMFGMEIEGSETFEDGFSTLHEVVETQNLTEVIGNIYENPELLSK
jgi:uncharacterized phage protein (TIGR01671 family)